MADKENGNDLPVSVSSIFWVLGRSIARAGPWAALALVILWWSGRKWESESQQWDTMKEYAVAYIKKSSDNSDRILTIQEETTKALQALAENQDEAIQNRQLIIQNQRMILEDLKNRATEHATMQDEVESLTALVRQAYETMKNVPAQREEEIKLREQQVKLLEQILTGIEKLSPNGGA